MENNIADRVSLERLAFAAGISPRQLNRLFQKQLGRSTMRYYREMRLNKAQNLLRNSPLALTEVALASGFFQFITFFAPVFPTLWSATVISEITCCKKLINSTLDAAISVGQVRLSGTEFTIVARTRTLCL